MKDPSVLQDTDMPIIGNDPTKPTSSDVHLFSDPSNQSEKRPLFYADCEGFRGGDRAPIAAAALKDAPTNRYRSKIRKLKLRWNDLGDNSKTMCRSFIVKNFYPMVLYIFSDVVCYVTRNFQ